MVNSCGGFGSVILLLRSAVGEKSDVVNSCGGFALLFCCLDVL